MSELKKPTRPEEVEPYMMAQNVMLWNGVIEVVDWGQPERGQGRRSGGMVKGSMSNAPRGVKLYTSLIAKLPERDHDDLKGFGIWGLGSQLSYVRARAGGYSHEAAIAFVHAWKQTLDSMKAAEALLAIDPGNDISETL